MKNKPPQTDILGRLLDLSHQLGREDRKLAILGEGNTSARVSGATFVVKASVPSEPTSKCAMLLAALRGTSASRL